MPKFTITTTALVMSLLLIAQSTNMFQEKTSSELPHMVSSIFIKNIDFSPFLNKNGRQPAVSEDQEIIEGIIYDLPYVEPGTVIIIGDNAWVNVMFDNNMSDTQRKKLVMILEKRLSKTIPKYNYQIIVNEFMQADKKLRN